MSSTTIRFSSRSTTGRGAIGSTGSLFGTSANHFSTAARTSLASTSPAITRLALAGPYHFLKKSTTSCWLAAQRSAIEPITGQEYGWSFGKSAGGSTSSTLP